MKLCNDKYPGYVTIMVSCTPKEKGGVTLGWLEVSIWQDSYCRDTLGNEALKERKVLEHGPSMAEE